jgi:hypothetical protein
MDSRNARGRMAALSPVGSLSRLPNLALEEHQRTALYPARSSPPGGLGLEGGQRGTDPKQLEFNTSAIRRRPGGGRPTFHARAAEYPSLALRVEFECPLFGRFRGDLLQNHFGIQSGAHFSKSNPD